MRLYLVRHGEAEGNRERRYIGWEDVPLSAAGRAQAGALARRLAGERLTAVWSSDLRRARETAEIIAAEHGLTVRADPGLREVNFGAWSGLTYAEMMLAAAGPVSAWLADPERHAPPGGESLAELRRRALAALPLQDGALVVTHGGTLRALLSFWLDQPLWAVAAPLAGLTVVDWEGGHPRAVGPTGDTTHLEGLTPS